MKKTYQVAGQCFAVEASEAQLRLMYNYAPFEVASCEDTPLLFTLRVESFDVPLDAPVVFSDSQDEDMPRIEVSRLKDGAWLIKEAVVRDAPVCMFLRATEDFKQAQLRIDAEDKFALDNACMLLFAFTTTPLGTLEMHASVTVRGDRAYLFLGKSGTGKSTHSRQWLAAFSDAWLLNDDNPILRYEQGENGPEVYVYGSPWSGKTSCYINRRVRVGAIIKLVQAPENIVHDIKLSEAYAYMLSSASGLKVVPEMMDLLYSTIAGIIQTIKVYKMDCLPNPDAARVCWEKVHD